MTHFPSMEAVRMALKLCPTPALDIYTATQLTPAWQTAVASGRTTDPGYVKTVALVEYLKRDHIHLLSQCEREVKE